MDIDEETSTTMSVFEKEAAKNAINAFTEGYLLGIKHAKKVLGAEDENKS